MGMAILRMCVPASVQMRNSSGFHFFCLALTLRMLQALARMDTPEQTSQASVLALMMSSFMVVTSSTMLEQGGAKRNCWQVQVHTRRRRRWWWAGGGAENWERQASYLGGCGHSMDWAQLGMNMAVVQHSGMLEGEDGRVLVSRRGAGDKEEKKKKISDQRQLDCAFKEHYIS